ncbi:P-loop containing nucleoside triphosphate hydrolase protein [Microdochium trichocladiopsis]|uniref:ATP-dependent RNA helicase n=1 Tax=Microdochium trichocladiopsis TaxID=1682393 RepID=A0A9P8YCL7_9PEZI|nr:P-loop containing nucleoside triphosphate hydrolase protein [Microdochium trichocladiopsis]KAH7035812.1 P-loop containing nucleoside triphosphate hydrolase protein [Microdochium trichocladiopsis]
MADSGMLLNFDIGDEPLKRQVKYTGGRWRDRLNAQRNAKTGRSGPSSGSNDTPVNTDRRRSTGTAGADDQQRPAKRQRTSDGSTIPPPHRAAANSNNPGAHGAGDKTGPNRFAGKPPGSVTSRLFTSNPVAKTVFEDESKDGAEDAEPAKPSNAPLSEEAANFHALGLSRRIAQHLSSKLEMKAPTSIQKNAIAPLVKDDTDAFLQAETGSGKTLAYLLPIVQRILALSHDQDGNATGVQIHRDSGLFALILAPTRELCKQIANVLEKLLRCTPWIVSATVMGGESKKAEKARLRKGVNILIATPGRLADHLDNTKVLDVGTVRWLVLDEGDRLMELGFEEELKSIVAKIRAEELKTENKDGVKFDVLPQRRVTVLCSATMKMNVQKLGEISLQDAIHVTASKADGDDAVEANDAIFQAPAQLKQSFLIVPAKLRLVTLLALLKSSFARKGSVMKAIVFFSCTASVDFHFDLIRSTTAKSSSDDKTHTVGTVADAAYITGPANTTVKLSKLHGSLPQPVRTATLAAYRDSKEPCVLLTTDIASRGLDVPAVDLVIEYDPAFCVADHVHRVGRTARAGRNGKAVLFLQPGCEEGYIKLLNATNSTTTSYEPILQKGFITPVVLPKDDPSAAEPPTLVTEKQSPNARAEALQLHIEQRLLASDKEGTGSNSIGGNPKLLDASRKAFRGQIAAYATHVREEREHFDIAELHLGHTAKSFGLREAPGGIGMGPTAKRRIHKTGDKKGSGDGGKRASTGGARGGAGKDSDDEGAPGGVDADAARRMKMKMMAAMNAASEFNIG